MSFKLRYAKRSFLIGLDAAVELNQAFIGGSLLGAFISQDYLSKEEVEEWVQRQEEYLFYGQGALEGIKLTAPWLYNAYWHYLKAQAVATCVYKRYWRVKTFIKVEETGKTEEKATAGECTLLEAPECRKRDMCQDTTEFYERE